jgi:thiosulfate dehydrogenase [quinone] large subunit
MIPAAAKSDPSPAQGYTNLQVTALVALRILIGWHFLYEGLAKLFNPYWTSAGYLAESQWWFQGFFLSLATSPTALAVVDVLNSWGLVLIGLGLMLGCLTRSATVAGMVLLLLYYIAAPPFVGYEYTLPAEGSYLIVNKVLIELVAVSVLLAFPTGSLFGLDKVIPWKNNPAYKALSRARA